MQEARCERCKYYAKLGHRVLPFDDCDNFDYQTGCKGHPVEEGAAGDESA